MDTDRVILSPLISSPLLSSPLLSSPLSSSLHLVIMLSSPSSRPCPCPRSLQTCPWSRAARCSSSCGQLPWAAWHGGCGRAGWRAGGTAAAVVGEVSELSEWVVVDGGVELQEDLAGKGEQHGDHAQHTTPTRWTHLINDSGTIYVVTPILIYHLHHKHTAWSLINHWEISYTMNKHVIIYILRTLFTTWLTQILYDGHTYIMMDTSTIVWAHPLHDWHDSFITDTPPTQFLM